jgi:two-component system, NarL family, sensor kinase
MTQRAVAQPALDWLRLARWLVLALVAASLLAVLASLVLAPAYMPTRIDAYELNDYWRPEQIQAALADLGWRATTVAWFMYLRNLVTFLGMAMPAMLILRRKSHDWFGLYVVFTLIVPPALTAISPLAERIPALAALVTWAGAVSWQFFLILFYVFPDGRFVPRWTRWLIPIWIGFNLLPGWLSGMGGFERFPILLLVPFPLVLIAIGSQFYRYFWRSNATQRLQTKWVVFALVGTFLAT